MSSSPPAAARLRSPAFSSSPAWASSKSTADSVKKFDVKVKAHGGGLVGQAGALSLALARALIQVDPALRTTLKKPGLLRRDPREKERKKPGQPGARKRFQFSKR